MKVVGREYANFLFLIQGKKLFYLNGSVILKIKTYKDCWDTIEVLLRCYWDTVEMLLRYCWEEMHWNRCYSDNIEILLKPWCDTIEKLLRYCWESIYRSLSSNDSCCNKTLSLNIFTSFYHHNIILSSLIHKIYKNK